MYVINYELDNILYEIVKIVQLFSSKRLNPVPDLVPDPVPDPEKLVQVQPTYRVPFPNHAKQ
jgi:hypothetical protein